MQFDFTLSNLANRFGGRRLPTLNLRLCAAGAGCVWLLWTNLGYCADLDAPPPPSAGPKQASRDGALTLPAGTSVSLMLDEPLSSKTSREGAHFRLHLAESIFLRGELVVPAGAMGEGEVIHAIHSSIGGKPGELILAARYIEHAAVRIPLGHFRWGRAGSDKTNLSVAVAIATAGAGFLIKGGETTAPAGTVVNAQLTADVNFAPTEHRPPDTVIGGSPS